MDTGRPPWEGDGPIVRRWLTTALALQTRPDASYGAMAPGGPAGPALGFAALGLGTWQLVGSAPWLLFFALALVGGHSLSGDSAGAIGAVAAAWLLYAVAIWLVGGTLLIVAAHGMLVITGGTAGGFGQTVRALAYGFGSATPGLMLPYVGWPVFALLGTVSATFGLGALQRVGLARALVALLLPAFLCGGGTIVWFAYLLSTVRF
jgi:hypothetical protein